MQEFLQTPFVQIVLTMATFLILLTVAYYVVTKFRDSTKEDRLTANDLLTNFRELREQGDISEKEFRNIRSVLGTQLREEISDGQDEG